MIEKIKKDIKINYRYYLMLILLFIVLTIRFDYDIYSPGGIENLDDRIIVEDAYKYKGSFNLTYVTSRKATIPTIILSYIIPSWDMVSLDEQRIENESAEDIINRNKIYLKETSYNAIIAAYKEAELNYVIESVDVTVTYVFDSSISDLKVGDIIKEIDGVKINSFNDIKNIIDKHKENDKINIKVIRKEKEKNVTSILHMEEGKLLIGVSLAEIKNVNTEKKIEYIFKDNESGASRGLLCALDIYNKVTEYDLTKGKKISGTGSIDEDGNIGEISGVKYKLSGSVKNKSDVFIVPKENYEEALKVKEENNYDIDIIYGSTLKEVIEKLKNL